LASLRATDTRRAAAGSRGSTDATAGTAVRSRTVRKILRLDARARHLLARYERARGRATRPKAQAYAVLDEASSLEVTLTGMQLGELRRVRGDVAREAAPPGSAQPDDPPTTITR